MSKTTDRYVIIDGKPFQDYNSTTVFTSLDVIFSTNCFNELKELAAEAYDECAGLIMVLDTETNEQVRT